MRRLLIALFFLTFAKLDAQSPFRTEEEFKSYFKKNYDHLDPLEGCWRLSMHLIVTTGEGLPQIRDDPNFKEVVIIRQGDVFNTYSYSGEPWWTRFLKTGLPQIYLIDFPTGTLEARLIGNAIEFTTDFRKAEVELLTEFHGDKLFPLKQDAPAPVPEIATGSGFALSSEGYIVTNYHVVQGAKSIEVRALGNDLSARYPAKTVVWDEQHDLAIVQVKSKDFAALGPPPIQIREKGIEVGENVFVLGYPLTSTMGEEIKLTNGIISSNSGVQGDLTTYQISAPVQPGNSGAPVFDETGQLIGVVNSKLTNAENVTYAIKSKYVRRLADLYDIPTTTLSKSRPQKKKLADQVRVLKTFVFIIEVTVEGSK